MATVPPSITAPPTVPDRSNSITFPALMKAAFEYLFGDYYTGITDLGSNVYINAVAAEAAQVDAQAAATAAASASGVSVWVSGTSYTAGNCVYSPTTFHTYRRKTSGAGTTDPASDTTNWSRISGGLPPDVVVSATTHSAAADTNCVLTNVAATTVTLPAAPADGATILVTVANSLSINIIGRNGKSINGVAEDMTIDAANGTVWLRYINSTIMWRTFA